MALSTIQTSMSAGEFAPSMLGRVDLEKYHEGVATMHNFFVNYRGGACSRAGTAYVGICKQPTTAAPPRDIPFQFSTGQGYALEFGDQYMRIKYQGAYVLETAKAVTGVSIAGVFTVPGHGFSNGDWARDTGNVGFNGLTWIVANVTTNTFTVTDLFGVAVTAATISAGGTVARLYTVVAPYAAVDLPYLKYTQSADTMTLCCVNQATRTEYPPYDLVRSGPTSWAFTETTFASSISAPTGLTATATSSATVNTYYSYVVTAVDATTGEESVASAAATIENNDISIYAGSNTLAWNAVSGASSYNVYGAQASYNQPAPVTSAYAFLGSAYGPSFVDTNIAASAAQVPPTHQNPFARGQITQVLPTANGSGYTQATIGYTVNTTTGSGFAGVPVVVGGVFQGFVIQNNGAGYAAGDTIAITDSGSPPGSGATASITVGAQSGTYPGVPAYFQQRRVYADTMNNPDSYFMSQTGAYANFDSGIPTIDTDSITGSPWAQEVNGIQFMIAMPGGLVVFAGLGIWQLTGGNNVAITPADQTATPQSYKGCAPTLSPIRINYDILFFNSLGSIVLDAVYNFFVNIYTTSEQTFLSSHLFQGHTFTQWAYAEEPYKIIWCVRDDGVLLSFTFLKEQNVFGWARHDTNGQFLGVCAVVEPPVTASYFIVKRLIQRDGNPTWVYMSERMDNRLWTTAENAWCVDAGEAYAPNEPTATLQASTSTLAGSLSSPALIVGGGGYTSPQVVITDNGGAGSGGQISLTVVDGVITGGTVTNPGSLYTAPKITINDPTGSGAVMTVTTSNPVTLTASSAIAANVGDVVRIGGGLATVTAVTSSTSLQANLTSPILATVPNDPLNTPAAAVAGSWSISTPVSTVSGLNHLEGMTVAVVADGSPISNRVVSNGSVTLDYAASCVLVGLPFTCQLQTLPLDPPGQPVTPQGKRMNVYRAIVRVEASLGIEVGTNQVTAGPQQWPVEWDTVGSVGGMKAVKERGPTVFPGNAIPLFSGDHIVNVPGNWIVGAQVAIQQENPLPANVLAVICNYAVGDSPG